MCLQMGADVADGVSMSSTEMRTIMKLEVPFVVVLGQRAIKVRDILEWVPGSIVELGKEAEEDLQIRINNKPIGTGTAVKVGENFGVQISCIGDPKQRIVAMGPEPLDSSGEEADAEALAEALLDGQV